MSKSGSTQSSKLPHATPLGDILTGIIDRYGLVDSFRLTELSGAWPSLAGPAIARVTRLREIRQHVLVIAVSTSTWGQTLQLEQLALLEKIQSHPAGRSITALRFYHDIHAFSENAELSPARDQEGQSR